MGLGGLRSPRRGRGRLCALASAAAAALFAPSAAQAQATATARTSAIVEQPVTVGNSADMDFGKIAYTTSAGTIVLSPSASATCTITGPLVRTGTCKAAKFEGSVRFLFGLQVTEPNGNAIDLTGPGGATMRLDAFTYGAGSGMWDLGPNGTRHRFLILNLDGSYSFYMGGTLHVGANQAPGTYTGTFEIQLNYN